MRYCYYVILIIGCISCNKDAIPSPQINMQVKDTVGYHETFELIWHKRATRAQICRATFVYDEGVVFFTQEATTNAKDEIIALDLETGDTLWVWEEGPYFTNNRYLLNNILYFTAGTSVYAIDCMTGKTIWEFVPATHLAYMNLSVNNQGTFVSYQERNPDPLVNESVLYQLDLNGSPTEVFRVRASNRDGYTFNFDHMTPWRHPNGDIILLCESRSWNYGTINKGAGEYLAINLTTTSIYHDWGNLFNDIDVGGRCFIANNIAYLASGWNKLAAINLVTKNVTWMREIPESKATAALMPIEEFNSKLILSLGNKGHLNVFEKQTGELIQSIHDIGTEWFSTALKFHNTSCWFSTTEGLYQLNGNFEIENQLLNKEFVGTCVGSFTNGMDIHHNGYIYTTRGNDFVCLKLK